MRVNRSDPQKDQNFAPRLRHRPHEAQAVLSRTGGEETWSTTRLSSEKRYTKLMIWAVLEKLSESPNFGSTELHCGGVGLVLGKERGKARCYVQGNYFRPRIAHQGLLPSNLPPITAYYQEAPWFFVLGVPPRTLSIPLKGALGTLFLWWQKTLPEKSPLKTTWVRTHEREPPRPKNKSGR